MSNLTFPIDIVPQVSATVASVPGRPNDETAAIWWGIIGGISTTLTFLGVTVCWVRRQLKKRKMRKTATHTPDGQSLQTIGDADSSTTAYEYQPEHSRCCCCRCCC